MFGYSPAIEQPDHWDLPLRGRQVTMLRIDYSFGIVLWANDAEVSIRIEAPFTLEAAGASHTIDPINDRDSLCYTLGLFGKSVSEGRAYKTGVLELKFTDGTSIRVDSGSKFEPWEVSGSHGLLVVSLPDHRLAVWQPKLPT